MLYRPSTDLEQVIRNIISIRKRREWDPVLENLREWIPRLDAAKDPDAAIFRQRLQSIEQLVGLADSMVELFERRPGRPRRTQDVDQRNPDEGLAVAARGDRKYEPVVPVID